MKNTKNVRKNYTLYVEYKNNKIKLLSGSMEEIDDFTSYFLYSYAIKRRLLEDNFDNVVIEDGFLYSIDKLTTPEDWSTFICLYVDGEMSEVGLLEVQFKDGTSISFVDTAMSW